MEEFGIHAKLGVCDGALDNRAAMQMLYDPTMAATVVQGMFAQRPAILEAYNCIPPDGWCVMRHPPHSEEPFIITNDPPHVTKKAQNHYEKSMGKRNVAGHFIREIMVRNEGYNLGMKMGGKMRYIFTLGLG